MPLTQGVARTKFLSPDDLADKVDPTVGGSGQSFSEEDESGDDGHSQDSMVQIEPNAATSQFSVPVQLLMGADAIREGVEGGVNENCIARSPEMDR